MRRRIPALLLSGILVSGSVVSPVFAEESIGMDVYEDALSEEDPKNFEAEPIVEEDHFAEGETAEKSLNIDAGEQFLSEEELPPEEEILPSEEEEISDGDIPDEDSDPFDDMRDEASPDEENQTELLPYLNITLGEAREIYGSEEAVLEAMDAIAAQQNPEMFTYDMCSAAEIEPVPGYEYETLYPEGSGFGGEMDALLRSEIPAAYAISGHPTTRAGAEVNPYAAAVRNQGSWSTCWTFAAGSAGETAAKIKGIGDPEINVSENIC